MLGDDPPWSVECSHGRENAGGPGLRALIKAFFLILATVAVLEVGHADFSTNLLPCVSEKFTLLSNVAWEPYGTEEGRWIFMGIILRHPWEFSETSIWGPELRHEDHLTINRTWPPTQGRFSLCPKDPDHKTSMRHRATNWPKIRVSHLQDGHSGQNKEKGLN